jgi:hypothetical protein
MIPYLARGFLFVAILLVLAGVASEVSRAYPHGDGVTRHLHRIQAAYERADSIEILVLGNSHATYGIDTGLLPGKAHVLGLHWNDVFEVQHQVRVLLPRMPRLHTAIISLSYFSFHWDNAAGDVDYYLSSRRMFYAEQRLGPWIPGDFPNYVAGKTYWLARPDNWQNVAEGLRDGDGPDPEEMFLQTGEDLEQDSERRAARFMRSSAVMLERRNDLVDAAYDAVLETTRMLEDRGVRVILVTPPLYRSYELRVEESPIPAEMRALARRLVDEHGLVWIDGMRSDLSASPEFFMDADHLNDIGRARFTGWMMEEAGLGMQGLSGDRPPRRSGRPDLPGPG